MSVVITLAKGDDFRFEAEEQFEGLPSVEKFQKALQNANSRGRRYALKRAIALLESELNQQETEVDNDTETS